MPILQEDPLLPLALVSFTEEEQVGTLFMFRSGCQKPEPIKQYKHLFTMVCWLPSTDCSHFVSLFFHGREIFPCL